MSDLKISQLTAYTTPLDADLLVVNDTANSTTKKTLWSNIKATLKTYFDTLYSPVFTTSAGLASLLSDETGSAGGFVRAGSPTITTPTLSVPIITDLTSAQHTHASAAQGGQITDTALSSAVGIGKGGTGQTTAPNAINALLPTQTSNSGKYLTTDGSVASWGALGAESVTAQENITANDAVVIGLATDPLSVNYTPSTGHATGYLLNPTTTWKSQSYTTSSIAKSISHITFWANDNAAGDVFTASLRADSAGQPTGSDISGLTGTVSINNGGAAAQRTITFATPIPVSPSTTYHFIFRSSAGGGASQIFGNNSAGTGSNSSANSGSSWSAANGALELTVGEIDTVSGQISKATASLQSRDRNTNFVGFAVATATAGNPVQFQQNGVMGGFTGLTPGAIYYLSNTNGAISTTAGTVSRVVGIAISSTRLLIKLL